MSDNKSARDKKIYPLDVLKRHLDSPQLLPHENAKEFIQLFDSLEEYGKPQTSRDYLAVHQATVLTWDILRYQQMKIGVLRSHQRPALESLLRKIKVRTASKMGISEVVAQSEARELAAPWFKETASRPAMMRVIENAGYPPDALEVEAFQLALPALATIERLIVPAQKRLDKFSGRSGEDLQSQRPGTALGSREGHRCQQVRPVASIDEVSKWHRNGRSQRTGAMARKVVAHAVRKAKRARG